LARLLTTVGAFAENNCFHVPSASAVLIPSDIAALTASSSTHKSIQSNRQRRNCPTQSATPKGKTAASAKVKGGRCGKRIL